MGIQSPESGRPSPIRPPLLGALIVIATLAIAVDLVGILDLFGVETITDAIPPSLGIVVGGYLGIVVSDHLWWRVFSEE